jgi:hypothetical protein
LQSRNKRQVDSLIQSYVEKSDTKKILHLIVTHGFHVETYGLMHGGNKVFPDYCGISGVALKDRKDASKRHLTLDCHSGHITILKSQPPPGYTPPSNNGHNHHHHHHKHQHSEHPDNK